MILPPTLRPGDSVALIAPAGPVTDAAVRTAVSRCRRLGLEPVTGDAARGRLGYLAGPDRLRARDFERAIAGPAAAIWMLRGGYGAMRTLRHLDLSPLRDRPKAVIGFSDNTIIHLALRRLGVASFHGPHAGFRHFPSCTEAVFRRVVMAGEPAGLLPVPPGWPRPRTLASGVAEGPLVGGNLALLAASCGTPYQPDARGAVLVIEDVGEPLYRIDRMFAQLELAGVLDGAAGVALGEFTGITAGDGSSSGGDPWVALAELVDEILRPRGIPAVIGLPFGHGRENWTLPMGVRARLDADAGSIELLEPATDREGKSG